MEPRVNVWFPIQSIEAKTFEENRFSINNVIFCANINIIQKEEVSRKSSNTYLAMIIICPPLSDVQLFSFFTHPFGKEITTFIMVVDQNCDIQQSKL